MHLNREYLCCADAQQAARHLAQSQPLPHDLSSHRDAAEYILSAIAEGWFMLPYWREPASYSREQFGEIHHHLQHHPGLPAAIKAAEAAVNHAKEVFKGPLFELFGSYRNNRLPDPLVMAKNAHQSCPRKPLDFSAWVFTAQEFCDLVDDVSARCQHVHQLADVITWPGMLDEAACLGGKVDRLRAIGRPDWITPIVKSVHYSYLSSSCDAELKRLVAGFSDGRAFVEFVARDRQARDSENQANWRATKAMIRNVAAVLADAKSYHQAVLTKLLRRDLGRHFCVKTVHGLEGTRLVITTDTHLELGDNAKITAPFDLVNWVLALDDAMAKQADDVFGYWEACKAADAALAAMYAAETVHDMAVSASS
ncbi:TPA: hypothetical protein ACP3ZG_001674 [Pseudomonas aeruginosa]|uniref:Uncharacterized protein n=1 Tax=Pseudomonas aeruginosa TaxID=287 RepID=A0A241XRS1_PSEAI|nr:MULTISPECIES: hypothetical protein [Pseudomonas]ELG7182178.1 hypothetical protein [Pseudomonas aeruginosa]MBH4095036.1 hypothetical protein [Pseudomonas aeruginosa]MBI6599349.1 hypothetical protein [Pseudomonas sp. S4_EA_1b]MBI8852442.1 hypothetical protein [Pseudomonas aeruginosa]OBY58942.1 hypothetical protein A9513_001105 [Pseudomonas sp. AU12215]